ncbi:CsgG/HfaB family protein [Variovorax sp. Sphag1AA]|uniref:CsgG/HfaB family protein n=1 Tax=Variovorax sp. Sphag1AA TaxID=2587027 RepID=UPI0017E78198|nr:CsgG/HfaB family protein [Variovorax sp. Sphag1AA]MBB3180999.1 curli biogenesis system outer membrane secretion channel CsgG [Variovorax sp. Sphag1AA]
MRYLFCATAVATAMVLTACSKQEAPAEKPAPPAATNVAPPVPDVGKVANEKTTAEGFGATAGEAVAEAMKMAILQVNGAAIQSSTVSAKYGLDVSLGQDAVSLRANAFADVVKQRSGGVIQNFRMIELQEPSVIGGKRYKATIEAQIAKFTPSADMQKLKVVVGPIRFDGASLPMGNRSVSAAEVGATLRQRISDALVQTGRFAVLDREFSPEIERELDMISSGQAPSAELAKLSQAASADLVWSARVSNLAYNRHARQLKTSDRELVSYSGGWAISEKLVNVATRQVVASDSLRGMVPSTAATTLSQGIDSGKVLEDMSTDLVNQVVASVLRRTFPVTVVALDGTNVVLSQGGQALKEGARYAMVTMGTEMKDPQTGQSLGRVESPCCELVVERVTPNLSYGRLENVRSNLEQLPAGGLQLREQLAGAGAVAKAAAAAAAEGSVASAGTADAVATVSAPPTTSSVAKPSAQRKSPAQQQQPGGASKDDDKW